MYSCLFPKRVFNKVLNKIVYVSCDKCEACMNKRAYEYKKRCEREHLEHRFCFFVTLDYKNECLPVYTSPAKGYDWHSNREDYDNKKEEHIKYKAIADEDIDKYSRPVRYKGEKRAFAHLCIEDVQKYLESVRDVFKLHCRKYKKNYHDYKFRYFMCAEYGPTTFRPHYHLLVWFDNRSALDLLRKSLLKSWTLGNVHLEAVTTDGVSNYVAGYVSSFAYLPKVLGTKSIRPRCTFSQVPVLGIVQLTDAEISNFIYTGTSGRTEYDDREKKFIPYAFPRSVYNRYFPKCQGFSYKSTYDKLRVYRFVYAYFKQRGYKHTAENVDDIQLKDIEFPQLKPQVVNRLTGEVLCESGYDESLERWSYQDKYASLVAYKYYVKYGMYPEVVLAGIEKVYENCYYIQLCNFYHYQEKLSLNDKFALRFTINHDFDFLGNLPTKSVDLTFNQVSVLASYLIDIDKLYPFGKLSYDYLFSLHYENDPYYEQFSKEQKKYYSDKVKKKKMNDYKYNLHYNLVSNE